MHDAADDAAVVRPLDAPYIRRQMRFDSSPLFVAQPKQVPAHNPDPLPTTNQDRIVRAKKLMSSDPSDQKIAVATGATLALLDTVLLGAVLLFTLQFFPQPFLPASTSRDKFL